ncbi:PEP-CTERM sorting domain-containing protein [Pseudoduganella sp. CY13W]|uniref:PEP-CTERM sorting domain-containing protein n=1 Tax=Duganella qianjiadongensis TaxID=2692176 RepID=A0ABW9VNV6_9BURK|nr:PEP-CTERM sorting domain-containing protein [Duganella qianjiadongensis]
MSSALSVAASTTLNEDRVKAVYSNFANGYGHVTYTFTAAPVPEPETYGMLLAGLAMLGFIAKRNKRSA